jgi:hypothetical protein
MSAVTAAYTQQSLTQLNIAVAVQKSANEANQKMVNLIAASVDSQRGQNVNISA